ncbi:MAG: hypothetical protein ACJ79O_01950, partial [Myxococcales bacterium]
MSSAGCPRCAAPRVDAPDCPRCGVIYAKAEAHALAAVVDAPSWSGEADDEALEFRVRILAVPIALASAALLVWTGPGHSSSVRSRACGCTGSVTRSRNGSAGTRRSPGPWFTPVADARSPILAVLLAGALAYAVFRSWK